MRSLQIVDTIVGVMMCLVLTVAVAMPHAAQASTINPVTSTGYAFDQFTAGSTPGFHDLEIIFEVEPGGSLGVETFLFPAEIHLSIFGRDTIGGAESFVRYEGISRGQTTTFNVINTDLFAVLYRFLVQVENSVLPSLLADPTVSSDGSQVDVFAFEYISPSGNAPQGAGIVVDTGAGSNLSAVPLPAGGWMLLTGLGGIAALRRRKST